MKLLLKSGLLLITMVLGAVSAVHANEAEIKELKENISKRLPPNTALSVKTTPVKGVYEIMAGGQIMYADKDARYIFDGDLIDLKTKKNITEDTRGIVRLSALEKLGEKNMLVYTPKGKVEHTITIFTDIYCPYCRKLHNEMADYMSNGVKVRYIFVPFKGPKSVQASVSVWCADDKNKAMDLAKGGKEIEKKNCDNPISQHQALATEIGIRGTPAIMLESGTILPGYVPSAKLLQQLNTQL
ncbi:MAG: DsbC family protein [Gammaproteobacteria bacterium]|nr:DsbC family protein [Gammaproteobacteria bacterium]